jgi:iron complex outermembrane receptor protein
MRSSFLRSLLCFLLAFCYIAGFAQSKRTISGVVRDASGNGISGITFQVKGTNTQGITNSDGSFTVSAATNDVIEFTSVGYTATQVTVGSGNSLSVTMTDDVRALNEVIVTGFGIKKETRKLSYAVTEVKGTELLRANTPNLANALQGKVAGVMINQGAGGPTSGSRIRIRGNASLSGNTQPLFVIDGVLIQPGTSGADSWGGNSDFGNQINNLNADDYESVSVLKGSAASALYGSLAQNGVVVITTKKGTARKGLGVSFSHTQSFEDAYKAIDVQNEWGGGTTPNFIKGADGVDELDPNTFFWSFGPRFDGRMVRDVDGRMIKWSPNNDLLAIYQTGRFTNTNVAIDGGNERTTFRFSYTNTNSNSILPNNKLTKNNIFLRATQKLSSFINVDASVNYITAKGANPIRQGGNDNPLFSLVYFNPRHLDIDYWRYNYTDALGGQLNGNDDWYGLAGIYYAINNNNTTQTTDNLRANVDITSTIRPWLTLLVKGNINSDVVNGETKNWGTGQGYSGGSYSISQSNSKNLRFQGLLTASKQINQDFDFSLTVGGETNRNLGGRSSNSYTDGGLILPLKFYLGNSVNAFRTDVRLFPKSRIDALYSYGDVSFRNMLTLSFSARNDWSSNLTYPDGHGEHSYFYPSAGVSWIFTEMMKNSDKFDFLSFGKLRLSYGHTGRDTRPYATSIGNYAPRTPYQDINGTISPFYGWDGNTIGNLNLKNELTKELEIGVDLRFLKNRLGIDAAYYKKNTYNQIIDLAAPIESGVSSRQINAGNIQNSGVEILLSTVPIRKKNLDWTANFIFTKNMNKIIDLAPGVTSKQLDLAFGADVESVAKVGAQYGTIQTGYAYAYYQKKDASGNNVSHPSNGQKMIKTNAAYWRSQDAGQGSREVGTMMEKFLLSTVHNLRYKDFTFGFQVDSKIGGMMASATHQYGSTNGALKSTSFGRDAASGGLAYTNAAGVQFNDGIIPEGVFADGTLLLDPVTNTNVDVGGMSYAEAVSKNLIKPVSARLYYARLTQWSTGIREYSIFENSWVALREVSVGYNLPAAFAKKIRMSNLRVSVVGRNLAYFYNSAPDNINPESVYSNRSGAFAEYGGLPYIRSLGVTVNANF